MRQCFPKHLHMVTAKIKHSKDTDEKSNLRGASMGRIQAGMNQFKQNNIARAYHPPMAKCITIRVPVCKGNVLVVIRFLSFFLIVIKIHYDIGNNVWKFQVSTMKIVPVAAIQNSCVYRIMTQR